MPPDPHDAPLEAVSALATVGMEQGLAEHTGGVADHAPLDWHTYVAGEPDREYPMRHVTVTLHDPPTAMVPAAQAPVLDVAMAMMLTVAALEHLHTGGVPLKVPSSSQRNCVGEPLTVSPAPHVADTWHDAITETWAVPHCDVSNIAPLPFASDRGLAQRHTGGVPVMNPVAAHW